MEQKRDRYWGVPLAKPRVALSAPIAHANTTMTNADESYQYSRHCTKCGWSEEQTLSKRDAAFQLLPSRSEPCPNCSAESLFGGLEQPALTPEILTEWATDPTLYFMEQDEELVLADEAYVETLIAVLDKGVALPQKHGIIIEALCIIVFDNLNPQNNLPSAEREQTAQRVVAELIKRKPMVLEHRHAVMDYVQKVVFPKLDIAI